MITSAQHVLTDEAIISDTAFGRTVLRYTDIISFSTHYYNHSLSCQILTKRGSFLISPIDEDFEKKLASKAGLVIEADESYQVKPSFFSSFGSARSDAERKKQTQGTNRKVIKRRWKKKGEKYSTTGLWDFLDSFFIYSKNKSRVTTAAIILFIVMGVVVLYGIYSQGL